MTEKILIVDDDIDSLKLIGLMLQRHGYEVLAANSGAQALGKAAQEQPSLMILDVMMPDMDGFEVCRRMRADSRTQGIPIIMFTAKTQIDDKVAGFEAGADDYLTKPTHPAELASRVKAMLQRHTAAKPKRAPAQNVLVGVLGANGGIGTTTLAANITAAAALGGENAIVADFRPGAGTLGLMLGQGSASGMSRLLAHQPGEITREVVEAELIKHSTGLRALLCAPHAPDSALASNTDTASEIVKALRTLGTPVVCDLGSGLNAMAMRLAKAFDKLVVVVEPQHISIAMAKTLLAALEQSGVPRSRVYVVVVSRTPSTLQMPWQDVEQALGYELRAIISAAPELAYQSAMAATPMVAHQPTAIVSSQLTKLADELKTRIRSLATS